MVYAMDTALAAQARRAICGRKDPEAQADARPNKTEAAATLRVLNMTKELGVPVNFRQVSTKEGIDHLRSARAAGQPVGVKVNPQHLFLARHDLVRLGPFASVYPPLRSREDADALCGGLLTAL